MKKKKRLKIFIFLFKKLVNLINIVIKYIIEYLIMEPPLLHVIANMELYAKAKTIKAEISKAEMSKAEMSNSKVPAKIESFIEVIEHFRLNPLLYIYQAHKFNNIAIAASVKKESKISFFINRFMRPNNEAHTRPNNEAHTIPYSKAHILSFLNNTEVTIYKLGDYLKSLINAADLGDIKLFNKLSTSFHKLDFENICIWYSILHMISAIIISINPSCIIYNRIIYLLKKNCPDKISTILNTPFSIGESKNIRIIQIITQFVDVNGEYIDGLDIPTELGDNEETIVKRINHKINESLSTRIVMFRTLILHGANIYNTVIYNTKDGLLQCNLSPLESLIINIHSLLIKQNKNPSELVNFAKAINFSHHIILYLITTGYDIAYMISQISPEIKYILYSEKFIALLINFIIDHNAVDVVINIALKEDYFLVSILVAYINGDLKHNVLCLILYHQNIKIEHFLYKNNSHIVLELLINAESIAIENKVIGNKIINSFITILLLGTNFDISINFNEYPLLLNWLLEIEYIPVIEILLPKGLFLEDNILFTIFERTIKFTDNTKKLYCFNVIKLLLPYVSIRHFNGKQNIISALAPNKGINVNYSALYKKLIARKRELIAPISEKARILDKEANANENEITEIEITEIKNAEIKTPKKPKKKSSKKKSIKNPEATSTEAATAYPEAASTEAAAASTEAATAYPEAAAASTEAAPPVTTVIKAVDAMIELSKLATNEEASKIYDSVTTLCQLAIDRHNTLSVAMPVLIEAESADMLDTNEIQHQPHPQHQQHQPHPQHQQHQPHPQHQQHQQHPPHQQHQQHQKQSLHQKKILKRREKLITSDCILVELYRIVAGVIINYFDNNIRFLILPKNATDSEFCLILENDDCAYIESLIDGLEEIFKDVHYLSPSVITMETYSEDIQIKLLLCNAHSKLFNDHNITGPSRTIDSIQIINYLNTRQISDYKKLFIDEASIISTFLVLSEYKSILYHIDLIVSSLLDSVRYHIALYGSYEVGAEISTSDIDICILTESENYDYISHLLNLFSDIFNDLKFIPASVKSPNLIIMNTKNGIHIDLAFSNLRPTAFNSEDANIVQYLNNKYVELSQIDYAYLFVDAPSVYASYALLLGYHIINIAPNLEIYSEALIQIKINAIEQKIYGANYGYFNGATLSIMVLYVCISLDISMPLATFRDIVSAFYQIFSTWDWGIYGIIIDSKCDPLKLTRCQIKELDSSMRDFDVLVCTYGACASCTIWSDTLNRIQYIFSQENSRLNLSASAEFNAMATSAASNISKIQINGVFSQRGLVKKIKMIIQAFRENIDYDVLIYPEQSDTGIVICVNIPHLFDEHYHKYLAIANGAMH